MKLNVMPLNKKKKRTYKDNKTKQVVNRGQIDQVVQIMCTNMDKILERDGKLENLTDKVERLNKGAQQFQKSTSAVKEKQHGMSQKSKVVLGLVFLVLLCATTSLVSLIMLSHYKGQTIPDYTKIEICLMIAITTGVMAGIMAIFTVAFQCLYEPPSHKLNVKSVESKCTLCCFPS